MNNQKHLLVVDDQNEFTDFVVDVATRLGYSAQPANSARKFRELYMAQVPDVIVLDIVMPDSDGIELMIWLAEQKCGARIAIASGYGAKYSLAAKTIGEAQGSLNVTIISKPVKLDALRSFLSIEGNPIRSSENISLTD